MRTIHEAARQVPVVLEAEVVVVGGGPAGIAAAVAAARTGARTLLVERYGFLGGAGTAAAVTNFCGLYAVVDGTPVRVVRGIASEITEALVKRGAAVEPQPAVGGKTAVVPYDTFAYKRVADELVLAAGVQLRFHTLVVGAVVEAGRIRAVLTESKSGRQAIAGAVFVDASGDADLAAFAGAPWEKGDAQGFLQFPTMMFRLGGVDDRLAEAEGVPRLRQLLLQAEAEGAFRFPRLSVIVRPQPHAGEWRANMTRIHREGRPIDGTDVDDLTYAELEGRRQVDLYAEFLRTYVPGFAASYVIEAAPQVGIRETRRLLGQYVLREEDVLGQADFADAIGCNPWPVERHTADRETRWAWIPGRGYHQIPYRSLLPRGVDNLLVAGRCLSADAVAQSSLRVSGPCFAMGQAAGVAAALCAQRGVRPAELDVAQLQYRLRQQGAWI
ncbi:MAG: membrane protein [Candidatus Tectimicrobiota bacterium]|nr:MAG: membrane protein [Candidatus Tectomicrobia bacterium]